MLRHHALHDSIEMVLRGKISTPSATLICQNHSHLKFIESLQCHFSQIGFFAVGVPSRVGH